MLYLIVLLYIFLLLFFAYIVSRNETKEDFLIAGRNRNLLHIASSKFASNVGASWLLGYTAFAFKYGASMFFALGGYAVGYVIFAMWAAPKIYNWGLKTKAITVGELVSARTGDSFSQTIINILSAAIIFSTVIVAIIGGAKILESLNLPGGYVVGVFLTAGITLAYLLLSGFKGVVVTDIFQSIILVIILALVAIFFLTDPQLSTFISQKNEILEPTLVIGLALIGLVFFADPSRYQLIYAAKSVKAARYGMLLPLVGVLGMATLLLLIGEFAYYKNPTIDPDLAFITVFIYYLPPMLKALGVVMFLAAIMSSLDSYIYALASHLTMHKKGTYVSQKRIRLVLVTTVIWGIIVSLLFRSAVGMAMISAGAGLIPSIALIYILAGKKNVKTFYASLTGGVIMFLLGLLFYGTTPTLILFVIAGGFLGLICGILFSYLKPA